MAKFNFSVSDTDIEERISGGGNYDPIPEDDYTLELVDAEEKETKDRTGSYINAKFEVKGGAYDSRYVWHIFNVVNKSEKAQAIGRQQVAQWAHACGRPDVDDTDKLVGKKFRATVEVQEASGGYKASNRIKAFLLSEGGSVKEAAKAAPAAKAPPATKAAAAPAAKAANPWD